MQVVRICKPGILRKILLRKANPVCLAFLCLGASVFFCGIFFSTASAKEFPNGSNTAWSMANAVRTECHSKHEKGELKTQVEMVDQCINPRIMQIYKNIGYPHMDLILLIGAKRLELAEQVDAGKVTLGQASVTLAEFAVKMTEIARQRDIEDRGQKDSPHLSDDINDLPIEPTQSS